MPPSDLAPETCSAPQVAKPDATEASPLLANQDAEESRSDVERRGDAESKFTFSQLQPVVLAILTLVVLQSGGILQEIPLNQVLEDIICRNVFANGRLGDRPSDEACKRSLDVQSELATLKGWQATFELIPGIITAVPYGFVADKYGRRPILCLALFGIVLTQAFYMAVCRWPDVFPVRLTWLSSIFTLIGGGPVVINGIIYSIMSNLAPARVRSNIFFYMAGVVLAAEFATSPIAVALMNRDAWLPINIGFILYFPGLLLAYLIPEAPSTDSADDAPSDLASDTGGSAKTIWEEMAHGLRGLQTATTFFILGNKSAVALLSTMLLTTLGRHAPDILFQFARRRYGWSWGQAGLLLSLKAGVLAVLLLLILPTCSVALSGWLSYSATAKDLLLARASCIIMLVGAIMIGLSINGTVMVAGYVVYCLGSGYSMVLRSLLASVVEPHHRGTMFNTVGILESIGAVVAGPLLAACFRLGLELQGVWIGLPFLAAAGLFSIAVAILYVTRLPTTCT